MRISGRPFCDVHLPSVFDGHFADATPKSTRGGISYDPAKPVCPVPSGADYVRIDGLREIHRRQLVELSDLEEQRDRALEAGRSWKDVLAKKEAERNKLNEELREAGEKYQAERQTQDAYIKIASTQNTALLETQTALDRKKSATKKMEQAVQDMMEDHEKLEKKCHQLEIDNGVGKLQLDSTIAGMSEWESEENNTAEEAQLLQDTEFQVMSPLNLEKDKLERRLHEAKQVSMRHLQQIQHHEVEEHRVLQEITSLQMLLKDLHIRKELVNRLLDGEHDALNDGLHTDRDKERKRILEERVEALKGCLQDTEIQNEKLQKEISKDASGGCHEDGKLGALMDQLHRSQQQVDYQKEKRAVKMERITTLERQHDMLQHELRVAEDQTREAKLIAQPALQTRDSLEHQHCMIGNSLEILLVAHEKSARLLRELKSKEISLSVDNAYMSSRIDGHEWDKSALRHEVRRSEDVLRQHCRTHTEFQQRRFETETKISTIQKEAASIKLEIDQLRSEDMQDEVGRIKPIIIESSDLVERLEINEFLIDAQHARSPTPLLIDKIAHILGLLQRALTEAERFADYALDSRERISKMHQRKKVLRKRLKQHELWKTRFLEQSVCSQFAAPRHDKKRRDGDEKKIDELSLEGLQLSSRHVQDLSVLIHQHCKQNSLRKLQLQDNRLDGNSLPFLVEIINKCPNLVRLDLRRNNFDQPSVCKLLSLTKRACSPTSTSAETDEDDNACRLEIDLDDQLVPDPKVESDSSSAERSADDVGNSTLEVTQSSLGQKSWSHLPDQGVQLSKLQSFGLANAASRSPSLASDSTLSMRTSQLGASSTSALSSPSRHCSVSSNGGSPLASPKAKLGGFGVNAMLSPCSSQMSTPKTCSKRHRQSNANSAIASFTPPKVLSHSLPCFQSVGSRVQDSCARTDIEATESPKAFFREKRHNRRQVNAKEALGHSCSEMTLPRLVSEQCALSFDDEIEL